LSIANYFILVLYKPRVLFLQHMHQVLLWRWKRPSWFDLIWIMCPIVAYMHCALALLTFENGAAKYMILWQITTVYYSHLPTELMESMRLNCLLTSCSWIAQGHCTFCCIQSVPISTVNVQGGLMKSKTLLNYRIENRQ